LIREWKSLEANCRCRPKRLLKEKIAPEGKYLVWSPRAVVVNRLRVL
jgi:hypothetical protein